ncbi:hypothetical protein TAMA11512_04830 [Selenomonas sp. TAMA-11512]|uniref:hypothetical protein n=1 Tax=Selenomonas sp. TAMA-11512 TaxID=3095337 RepID=UPI00308B464F|nr:hypothetical protein TAMA11512_04830 [Selenomonas sp. TAMA-11512]
MWLPRAEPVEDEGFLWVELGEESREEERVPENVIEETPPAEEAAEDDAAILPENPVPAPPAPPPASPPESHPPKPSLFQKNKKEIKSIGRPAVIQPATRVSLKETETAYRGEASFYVTVTSEGCVAAVKEMSLEPPVEDKVERRALEAKIAALVIYKWRYTPSRTADGTPQEQTKWETLTIPMSEEEKK